MTVAVGDLAPDFTLPTADGDFRLADHQGKTVVLYFYPRDNTPGCTTEATDFSRLDKEFAAANAIVIGVSKDSVASHRRFAEKQELTIILGSDPEGEVIAAYDSWVPKKLYGREYMGIDRATFLIGADGRIRQIWRKVKVKGHAEAVLAAIRG